MNDKPNFDDFFEIVNSDEYQAYIENYRNVYCHQNTWNYKHPESLKNSQDKYNKTDKGRKAIEKVKFNRKLRMIEAQADLDYEQKTLIRDFYYNCPEGYEVDHIVPISRGGKHCISNLQYLTPEENRKKASRLYYKQNTNN